MVESRSGKGDAGTWVSQIGVCLVAFLERISTMIIKNQKAVSTLEVIVCVALVVTAVLTVIHSKTINERRQQQKEAR